MIRARAEAAERAFSFGPDDIERYRQLGRDALRLIEALEKIATIPHNVPTAPSATQIALKALDG